jgi:predicted nuclease of predicted toxin-antitoxin system
VKAFLFDENVPSCLSIVPTKPLLGSRDAIRARATDREVWDFAKRNECAIISKDADFSDLVLANQPPPMVVHLCFGNLRRRDYHRLLAQVWPRIESLLPEHKLIRVFADRIEAFKK